MLLLSSLDDYPFCIGLTFFWHVVLDSYRTVSDGDVPVDHNQAHPFQIKPEPRVSACGLWHIVKRLRRRAMMTAAV